MVKKHVAQNLLQVVLVAQNKVLVARKLQAKKYN
jgi:hypothetical protein